MGATSERRSPFLNILHITFIYCTYIASNVQIVYIYIYIIKKYIYICIDKYNIIHNIENIILLATISTDG